MAAKNQKTQTGIIIFYCLPNFEVCISYRRLKLLIQEWEHLFCIT
jgi:hypothetical protein